jgi:PEP-CTERM motif
MALPGEGMLCCFAGRRLLVLLAGALWLTAAGHASLITINPTFDATITSDPNHAAIESTINAAINYYDTTFTTSNAFSPLTVNITFQENNSPGSLGSSLTTVFKVSYLNFITNLHTASSGDATDTTALAGLPVTNNNPVPGSLSASINLKSANCRALGLGCTIASDGTIAVNTSITNPIGVSNPNNYSLFAVTEHEIDEVLGLGSDANSPAGSFFSDPAPEDLFRYCAPGSPLCSAGTRVYNTSAGFDDAWFSLDGKTFLVQFNNDATGVGGDYGDWWSNNGGGNPGPNPPPRVQDAFAYPGTNPTLANELNSPEVIALDAIGYNLAPLATPEPTTMLMVGSGLLAAVLLSRRRRTRVG